MGLSEHSKRIIKYINSRGQDKKLTTIYFGDLMKDFLEVEDYRFEGLNFEGDVVFNKLEAKSLFFVDCQIGEIHFIDSLIIEETLLFENCRINGMAFPVTKAPNERTIVNKFRFISSWCRQLDLGLESYIESVEIKLNESIPRMIFGGSVKQLTVLGNVEDINIRAIHPVNILSIEYLLVNLSSIERVEIDTVKVNKLHLESGNDKASIDIHRALVDNISFSNVCFSSFSVPRSMLLKGGFKKVSIIAGLMSSLNSILSKVANSKEVIITKNVSFKGLYYEGDWPKNLNGSEKDNQITYRKLKEIMVTRGDYELESHYHSMELQSYYEASKQESKKIMEWVDFIFKVWLPYKVSKFGQSLARPAIILLILHMLLVFTMIAVSGSKINLEWTGQFSWNSFWEGARLYAYTILPTHRLSYLGEMMDPIVSLFMRLVSSITIYHIVLASRKHLQPK